MATLPTLRHPLALKVIRWDTKKKRFVSPSWDSFSWDSTGLVTSACWKNEKGHPPDENCGCGLYCSYRLETVEYYMKEKEICTMMLVEAYGKTDIYEEGWISKQMLVRGIIWHNSWLFYHRQAAYQASTYFNNLEIMTKEAALISMDLWNLRLFQGEGWYVPESAKLKKMSEAELSALLERCP